MATTKRQEREGQATILGVSMLSSAMAGIVARTTLHPVDTLKTIRQTHQSTLAARAAEHSTVFSTIKHVFQTSGFRGFYCGYGIAALGSIPAQSFYFTTYEAAKRLLPQYSFFNKHPFLLHFVSGFLAEMASSSIWVPIDVIKQRQQLSSEVSYGTKSLRTVVSEVYKANGIRGFYKGVGATLTTFGPFSALYFLFYEEFKKRLQHFVSAENDRQTPAYVFLVAGALAGALAGACTNPLDVVKVRLQVQGSTELLRSQYKNLFDGIFKIMKEEGFRGLMRGVEMRVAFSAPATALTIFCYEEFKKLLWKYYESFKYGFVKHDRE